MKHYDLLVLGVGGVGAAAAYHAAKRGLSVLALDRFPYGHDRGSSHGQTRIIRQVYFEHPDYVPLLFRAYDLWRELESVVGQSLLTINGLLQIGPPEGEVISGVLESARRWNLPIETLDERGLAERFPQFSLPPGCQAVYEAQAGVLYVEACVRAHAAAAQQLGAEFRDGVTVLSWRQEGGGVRIETDQGDFQAERAVATPGAWATDLLGCAAGTLQVLRKQLHWFPIEQGEWRLDETCPSFLYELPHGVFYGLPAIDAQGVKIGEHSGGAVVNDPLQVDRGVDVHDQERVAGFVRDQLRGLTSSPAAHAVCFYTMSPDQHFLVGRHPKADRLVFACGLSGHGFKFTPVLGEALVSLALEETPPVEIGFLNPRRLG